ncbi:MAG: substrate-binding domain-containing protein [Luteolibacter sp.]
MLVSTQKEWGRRLIQGILTYANEIGPWHVWVNCDNSSSYSNLPKGWHGDGVIARVVSSELGDELTRTGLPVVNVGDNPVEGFSAPCIRTDDRAGARMAVEHFAVRALRNVAFAGPMRKANAAWYAKAFEEEAKAKDMQCHTFSIDEFEPDYPVALVKWLESLPKPVGLLVWGHEYALQVVNCCMEAGICVPHDVAVLSGGHDSLLCRACFPALSGILSPTEQIGYQAARLMDDMMKGKSVPAKTTYLPPTRIVKERSTEMLAVEDPQLEQVVRFLREHAFEPITMGDILKAVPMARRSLERRFLQAFGRSPTDEIKRLRIAKARKLLAETDLQMQDIAESCGYATYNYLTHVFKASTGDTPRDYRKRSRS